MTEPHPCTEKCAYGECSAPRSMSGCGGCCGCLGPCIVDYKDAEIAKQYAGHPDYEPPKYRPIS